MTLLIMVLLLKLDDSVFIFMLFAEDMIILGNNDLKWQHSLDILHTYCTTAVPTKGDSDEILCLQLFGKSLTCTLQLS